MEKSMKTIQGVILHIQSHITVLAMTTLNLLGFISEERMKDIERQIDLLWCYYPHQNIDEWWESLPESDQSVWYMLHQQVLSGHQDLIQHDDELGHAVMAKLNREDKMSLPAFPSDAISGEPAWMYTT
jgi:hypothetical protein